MLSSLLALPLSLKKQRENQNQKHYTLPMLRHLPLKAFQHQTLRSEVRPPNSNTKFDSIDQREYDMKLKTDNKIDAKKPEVKEQSQATSTPQRDARRRQGQELRKKCPRSSHAQTGLDQIKRDPLALLEESNQGRVENLVPIRFTRMIESPFAFFRGTAILQAHDLQATPNAGIAVQCCGDCHLMNFGGFATPERTMAFDINDFDETHPGPFEWDIKRLATSMVLAARWRGFGNSDVKQTALVAVTAYREAQSAYAEMSALNTWYAKITLDQLLKDVANDATITKRIQKDVAKAAQNTSEHVYHKITNITDGKPRIVDQPPLLYHGDSAESDIEPIVFKFFQAYRDTLPADRRALFERYKFIDAAHKVVGVGSVGTRCYVALFVDWQDDHLFLQVKEARPSVLEGRACQVKYANQGERVVTGQRLMQAASDIFLGWTRGPHDRDFYVRQLRDMKITADITAFTPRLLAAYARLCGQALARAHAKAGDATMIAGYLGSTENFDQAIRDYAIAYADQVELDYADFKEAAHNGRFPIETLPSETEQAIR
jgi:uncharacterized protein (DUF2252 family)